MQVPSPILNQRDFDLLTFDGAVVTVFMQVKAEQVSSLSLMEVREAVLEQIQAEGHHFIYHYSLEPKLSRTKKFAQLLREKLSDYDVEVQDQCAASFSCEFTAKVDLCIKKQLKGVVKGVVSASAVMMNVADEDDGESEEDMTETESEEDNSHETFPEAEKDKETLVESPEEYSPEKHVNTSDSEEDLALLTFTEEFNNNGGFNIPQTLAGMLSIASQDAVDHIKMGQKVKKMISYGISACGDRAHVLVMNIILNKQKILIFKSQEVDILTAFNYVLYGMTK